MKKLVTIILFFIAASLYSQIPNITVLHNNNPAPGKLFMGNLRFGTQQEPLYLLILNNDGSVFWSRQQNAITWDFKKQSNGLLTYMSTSIGIVNLNLSRAHYSLDSNYNIVDSFRIVSPPNDTFWTDHHECIVLPNGHALLLGLDYQRVDMSLIVPGGNTNANVEGYVIQEIDEDNNLLFEWNTFEHFLIEDAIGVDLTRSYIDPWHVNAIEMDSDGNILISSRHLNEITKINRQTGAIIWRLGGPHNEFTFINDSINFSYQHDIRRLPNGNVTLFDNGNFRSPPAYFSRAVEYQLNEVTKVATLVWQYRHTPDIYGFSMGSVQRLPNDNTLISWGSASPTLTEVNPLGQITFEMTFPAGVYTYRTFKGDWPVPAILTLDLSAIMEGFYDSSLNKMIEDTVCIFLRNTLSPYSIIDSAKGLLDSNGMNSFSFINVINGNNYYVVVRHRNSVETWSGTGVSFSSNYLLYNFTSSPAQAYGNNLVQVDSSPLRFAVFGGDADQDGVIDGSDLSAVDNDAFNLALGYINTDMNGDNFVDASDLSIVDNNAFNVVTMITP